MAEAAATAWQAIREPEAGVRALGAPHARLVRPVGCHPGPHDGHERHLAQPSRVMKLELPDQHQTSAQLALPEPRRARPRLWQAGCSKP